MNRRLVATSAVLAFVATGCFKVDLTIVIEDDGSGRIEGLTAVNAEQIAGFGEIFGEAGGEAPSRDEICADFLTDNDVPEGATAEPYDEGGFCGVRFSQEFTAEEMDAALSETAGDDGDFVIERDGDGWRFEAMLASETTEGAEFFPDELFDGAEFVIRVRLPGRQVEHNADRIESDGTMVWELDLFNPGPNPMARTEPGTPITGSGGGDDGGSNVLVIVLIVVVLAAAGAGLWWFLTQRKKNGASPDGEGSGFAAPDGAPVAPAAGPPPAAPPPSPPTQPPSSPTQPPSSTPPPPPPPPPE